jgi:hypothetical protein
VVEQDWHVAQVNIAVLQAPLDSPQLAGFVQMLEPVNALADYVFASRHAEVLRRRREWFEKIAESHLALWWVPAGTIPTIDKAERRLGLLRERGPSPETFTLRERFPAPDVTP